MILITRPEEEANKLADILDRQNFAVFVEPMIKIKHVKPDWDRIMAKPIQSFIATSKNAKKFIIPGYKMASIPQQGKNAFELHDWIIHNLKPEAGRLVYLRGDVISFDMSGKLQQAGFTVDEEIVYNSVVPDAFTQELLHNFAQIELALFFSARSLNNFLKLAEQHRLGSKLRRLRILCMSEEISKLAIGYKFAEVYTADEPNLGAMINKIDEVY